MPHICSTRVLTYAATDIDFVTSGATRYVGTNGGTVRAFTFHTSLGQKVQSVTVLWQDITIKGSSFGMPADGLPTVTIGHPPNTAVCSVKGQGADHRTTNRGGAASGLGPNLIVCSVGKVSPNPN